MAIDLSPKGAWWAGNFLISKTWAGNFGWGSRGDCGFRRPILDNLGLFSPLKFISTQTLFFWKDRWIHGQRILDIALPVFAIVSKRRATHRTVLEALANHAWVVGLMIFKELRLLEPSLSILHFGTSSLKCLCNQRLRTLISGASLVDGSYSPKSVYAGLPQGTFSSRYWVRIWKSWAPGKSRFFMWLVVRDRCWTVDRLVKWGLRHPSRCCNQKENINHLLLSCVFAQEFWFNILRRVGLQHLSPALGNILWGLVGNDLSWCARSD
jgi:hypothetical protein